MSKTKVIYDAYILHTAEDVGFATKMIEKMEEANFKVCVKERVFTGGSSDPDTIMRIISDHCDRLLVLMSPAFIESTEYKLFTVFTRDMSTRERARKVIPCMEKPFELPDSLDLYYPLIYREPSKYFNFWDKLFETLRHKPKA